MTKDSDDDPGNDLDIVILLNRFPERLDSAKALEVFDSQLFESGTNWLRPRSGEWHLDLDELKRAIPELRKLVWLRGVVAVTLKLVIVEADPPINGRFDHYIRLTVSRPRRRMASRRDRREVSQPNNWPRITPRQQTTLFHVVEWDLAGEQSFIHVRTFGGESVVGHDEVSISRSDLEQLAAKGYLHAENESPSEFGFSVMAEAHAYYDERKGHYNMADPGSGATTGVNIFLVHGHDDGKRQTVARFLERLGLEVIILDEQASRGRTIVEKFEEHAAEANYAVVLMTGDDSGGLRTDDPSTFKPRARQNVIFELGYFAGKLGRGRLAALHGSGVEIPSDYQGVVYIPLDAGDSWRLLLARELREAQLPVDLNKV